MRSLSWRPALSLSLLLLIALGAGCRRAEPVPEKALLFPWLAEQQEDIDRLQLKGAGNVALVTLARKGGKWRVAERADWPADEGRLSQYLFVLSQTHLIETKTANPQLYSRLGVEPISAPGAAGTELSLWRGDKSSRLLIGHEHAKFNSNYVRVDGQAQSWLTDLPVTFDRDPLSWLDRRLVDLPLARIAQVQVSGGAEKAFSLSHREDRFRLDDAPSAAMRDSYQGDAVAGALEQLRFDDLAADDGAAAIERELRFVCVDGRQVRIQAWNQGDRLWARLVASLDEEKLLSWTRQAGDPKAAEGLRRQVADWNRRFHAHRFLLPASVAAKLMLSHDQILAGVPEA
jgi:hypothetical protein